ncbi:RHS repeat protein [Nitrospira defluvii]|nr:RHS repeat protein [Nitrospira defluvii]
MSKLLPIEYPGAYYHVTNRGLGYTSSITDAAGRTTRFERATGTNQLLSTTDPLGRKTAFTYDAFNNLLTTTDPNGNTTTFTYEPILNRVSSIIDPLGQTRTYTYDSKGNLLTTTDPSGAVITITYNAIGQPDTLTDPLGNVSQFSYDPFGNFITTTDPLGNITTRFYDPVSRLLTMTDPRGETTGFVYDNLNRVTTITDPGNNTTQFTYDENGNLLTTTDAKGNMITNTYDVQNRLESRTDPLLRNEFYTYNLNGNLKTFTDRKGQIQTFDYDPLDRRVFAEYGDGSQTKFLYDLANRLARVDDSDSTIEFSYDNLDRIVSEITPQGVISNTYDSLGRKTSISVNGQLPVSYQYDANSRLTQVAQGSEIVDLRYDLAGRRTSLTYPNGTSTSYTYDAASRLTNISHLLGTTPFESLTYTYDAAGNRISLDRTNGASVLLPDSVQAAYDAANEQIQFNSPTPNLSYDANGNLVSQTDASGTTTYTWDAQNRLIGTSGPGLSASFIYDGLGRRISKTVNGVQTDYQYDGNDLVAEIGEGAVGASYLRSLNIDEAFVRQSTTNEYYHVDALGSTMDLTDAVGTVSMTYEYEAFGKTTINGTSTNPFQYTGRENDGTGLYYYRARYFSSSIKRFISEDPLYSPLYKTKRCQSNYSPNVSRYIKIDQELSKLMAFGFFEVVRSFGVDPQRIHLYSYVHNNPVNLVDPMGLASVPKSPGCDVVGGKGGFFDSPCAKKCCDEHDQCFEDSLEFCTAGSWFRLARPGGCTSCNIEVLGCLADAAGGSGGGRKGGC